MKCLLCHKNIEVLSFSIEDGEIDDVYEILNENHLPIGIFSSSDKTKSKKQMMREWWRTRTIPASRQNLSQALETLGGISTEFLLSKSYGLSLSDHYWIKSENSNLDWEKTNFFNNDFSEDVGKALFGNLEVESLDDVSLLSPDNSSDGWLKKKWVINGKKRILLKGGSGTEQQEPFNEVLASEICRRLGFSFVDYKVLTHQNRFYSACEDFISTETELISAFSVNKLKVKGNSDSAFQHLLNCCEILGFDSRKIEEIKKEICQMIVLDSIILNSDRHFNNFGFVRNPDTLEFIGFSPIFDSGTSMVHDISVPLLKTGFANDSFNLKSKPFAKFHHEQIRKLPCAEYCSDLDFSKLFGIEEFFDSILRSNINISEERRLILCNLLKNRVKETEKLISNPNYNVRPRKNSEWER